MNDVEQEQNHQVEQCLLLLKQLVQKNDDKMNGAWIGAMFTFIAQSYHCSGITYEQYHLEMTRCRDFYKQLWNMNNGTSN